MYALQGVPMTTLARSIPSIFQKWCAFRLPNPLKIHFSKKGIPRKKISIPGDPGKTKPVKCIKPPPQNKRSWGGVGYPDPWILHLTYTHRSNNVFRGGPGESNSWRTVNVFFLPDLSPPKIHFYGWVILRKSRRSAPFLMLSSSKPEDISLNCSVFKLADRQIDRQTGRQRERKKERKIDR